MDSYENTLLFYKSTEHAKFHPMLNSKAKYTPWDVHD